MSELEGEKRFSLVVSVSDDSDYTSDVSYPLNSQANVNYPLTSMFHSTFALSPASHETKKPLAFVQPVIRTSSRLPTEENRDAEPLSYVSQPRKIKSQVMVEHK